MNNKVAILYGGKGKEHDVSLMGFSYMEGLVRECGFAPLPVYIDRCGTWYIEDSDRTRHKAYPCTNFDEAQENNGTPAGGFITADGFIPVPCAIPLLHGDGGEDGSIQGALECAHIPYIGADVCTSAVCLDKYLTKFIADGLGIPTLKCVAFGKNTCTRAALKRCEEELGYPMFIKPRCLGSSIGAYPVNSREDFIKYFSLSSAYADGKIMVEQALESKREIEAAFFSNGKTALITTPSEVLSHGFYGYDEKYGGKTETKVNADIDADIKEELTLYAGRLAEALSLRHLARIDFFLSGRHLYFNEINTFPGFTAESLYPRMLEENGISPARAIRAFIEDAVGVRSF